MSDFFSLWAPLDIVKGGANGGTDESPNLGKIGGIVSTETPDLQGETLVQDGIDWSYFQSKGYFNDEHGSGAAFVVGYPTSIVRKGNVTRVEGYLYLDKPRGRELYETARVIRKGGGGRSLGFSIEGKALLRDQRDPKRVVKSRVLHVAVTSAPVNPEARVDLLKSLDAAAVGYQGAAGLDSGASLSALVPQSMDQVSVNASANLRGRVRAIFPRLTDDEADRVLAGLTRHF